MPNRQGFAACHPVVNLVYFVGVLGFGMTLRHPLCLAISLAAALSCRRFLPPADRWLRRAWILALAMALLNPLISHQGVTVLGYLPDGNPLTLESMAYGAGAGALLWVVLLWFAYLNRILTTDKVVYLFGRVLPVLSLLVTLVLGFLPRFEQRARQIAEGQRALGRRPQAENLRQRLRAGGQMLSGLTTWALDGAVELSDSMRSRGYGLPGRTAFSLYQWQRRDRAALLVLVGCGLWVLIGACRGQLFWQYYPRIRWAQPGAYGVSLWLAYGVFAFLPVWMDGREAWQWKRWQSKT